ncbi:MAG: HAD-IB family hydrolase [Steroidobacterales bacterium]
MARSGQLAVFDLDGTITRHDTLLPFVSGFLLRHPTRLPSMLAVAPALLRFVVDRDRGRFKGSVIHAAMGGCARAQLDAWADEFVPRLLRGGLHREALLQIEQHRSRGDRLVLLSASPDLYVPRIGQALGFDETVCTELRWRGDGTLDGRLASENRRGEEKLRCLRALIAREAPSRLYAYGNARSDIAHLQLADEALLINYRGSVPDCGQRVRVVRWRDIGRA